MPQAGVLRVMRPLFCLPAALLVVLVASGAADARQSAEFDRVCETHAEGAGPDAVALPGPAH